MGKKFGKGLAEIQDIIKTESPLKMVNELRKKHILILGDGRYELTRDDIFIETVAKEGFAAASNHGITVSISIELDDNLIQEGIVRELIRIVQNMRKTADFAVEDRIEVMWDLEQEIKVAVSNFNDYFCHETLTVKISDFSKNNFYSNTFEINGKKVQISLKKYV